MTDLQPQSSGSRGLLILAGGGVLVGIAMAILTVAWNTLNAPRPVGVGGGGPTSIPERAAVGQPAPDFTAKTPGGQIITLGSLRGSPVAINFWATWCVPCRVEMPELQDATARYADQNLVVLGVNAGEPADQVQAFMDELGLSFSTVLDPDGAIADLYGIRAFPTTIWVDSAGIVRAKHLGPLTREDIDRYMAELVNG